MRSRLVLAIAALILATQPALAGGPPRWTVDHEKSKLGFSVLWSGEDFVATFKSWQADIVFDPADLAHSRVSVSIDVGSESSGFDENDEGLKGTQGFEVSRFPTARFVATKFSRSKTGYVAEGTLTLHGVTKPVTLPFTLAFKGKTARMVGKVSLMRADFGLARGEFGGDTPIARAVTVQIDLTASRP
jgi:polyisoprenoid-binding protein YceI